jgi:hypothetical protein
MSTTEAATGFRSDDFEIQFFEAILRRHPDYIDVLRCLAESLSARGQFIRGLGVDEHLAALRPQDPIVRYNLACSLSLVNRLSDAVAELKNAIALGFRDFSHMEIDGDLDNVRQHAGYQSLVRELRK